MMDEKNHQLPTSPYHRRNNSSDTQNDNHNYMQAIFHHQAHSSSNTDNHENDTPFSSPSASVGVLPTVEPLPKSDNQKKNPLTSRQVSSISMPNEQSGLFGAASNMVNSIVGAGIIGIPYAISNAGFVVGVALLILVSYLTDKTLRMIVELATFHPKLSQLGVVTYEDLARIPFGRVGSSLVMAGMFVLAYGAMVAYLLIIKDTVPTVLGFAQEAGKGSFVEAELTMLITSLLIVVPLSMMRDMASLEKTSLFSVICDTVLVGFVVAYAPVHSTVRDAGGFGQVLRDNWVNGRLFIGLGVLSTAMACQHSAFIVSNSLRDRTPSRWSMVTFRSITTSAILCLLLGITGYLGFLNDTQGDILNNFDSGSVAANAGRALLATTMFFTYPMEAFVARHVLVAVFYNGNMDGDTVGPDGETVPGPKLWGLFGRRHKVTMAIYIATLIPALIVDDLGPVLSLTGSVGASLIAYIMSGLVYLGINGDSFLEYCQNMLENHGYKVLNKNHARPTEVELPVVGDATATLPAPPDAGPLEAATINRGATAAKIPELPAGWKPWWWYLGGFPIWTAIAAHGAKGTHEFLVELHGADGIPDDHHVDSDEIIESNNDDGGNHLHVTIGPRKRDYYISMLLIAFGSLAAVVGVASNIYVQVTETFNTPTR